MDTRKMSMMGGTIVLLAAASILGAVIFTSPADQVAMRRIDVPTETAPAKNPTAPVSAAPTVDSVDGARPEFRTLELRLKSGDTLLGILSGTGIAIEESYLASASIKKVLDPRDLQVGQKIRIQLRDAEETDGVHLASLSLRQKTDRLTVVEHQSDESFEASERSIDHTQRLVSAGGEIETSLYEAARAQEVPMPVLVQTYQVLGHVVDFQRDLREGDRFTLGFQRFDDGAHGGVHAGDLLYASLTQSDRRLEFFRHSTSDGYTGFFDADGQSVETGLMSTPLAEGRLSSLFGRRKHSVLGYTRMHKGLDFAAPQGTPVLAAGDGIIVERGRNGSFGNYVRVRHEENLETAYAHLSRYAKSVESGNRVRQGDVIGYVGTTGLATGPNLHYEVLREGTQMNPMTVELPPRRKLDGEELARFRQATAKLRFAMGLAAATNGGLDDADLGASGGFIR